MQNKPVLTIPENLIKTEDTSYNNQNQSPVANINTNIMEIIHTGMTYLIYLLLFLTILVKIIIKKN